MTLFHRTAGDPAHPPIVILHGLFGSSDNWLTNARTLAEQGYYVILPDARNHGQSPRAEQLDYQHMAADIHELILALKLTAPVLVGHSMGGKVMMQYVMDYPNTGAATTFGKLVVVDIAPKFYPVHHTDILRGLNAIDLTTLKSRNDADATLARYEPSPTVRQFLLKNLYRSPDGFAWRLNLPVITRDIHTVGDELTNPRVVTEPTLFIRGSESGYVADSDWPAIEKRFPNARLVTIPGAGHWVQAEKPAEFVAALTEFLRG